MKAACTQEPCEEVVERLEAILAELEGRLPLPAGAAGAGLLDALEAADMQGMHRKTRGKPGAPDLIVCVPPDGKFLAVELKVRGARLESAQQTEIGRIHDAGGVVVVARCLEDLTRAIWKVRK